MGVAVGSASCGDAANAGSAPFTASTIDKQRAEVALLTLRGMGFSCFGERRNAAAGKAEATLVGR
jgi:hypothetical protein